MITIRSFGSRIEAELAQGLLESEGIPAVVSADDQNGLQPSLAFSSGIDLKVLNDEDAEAARALLISSFYAD